MQVKLLTRLLFLALLTSSLQAAGEELLPEWQKAVIVENRVRLPEWRFNDWGKRPPKGQSSGRSFSVTAPEGKVTLTLTNPAVNNAANMAFRSIPLTLKEKKLCRFKLRLANKGEKKALMQLQLTAQGKGAVSKGAWVTVSKKAETKELTLLLSETTTAVQITAKLTGEGEVVLTDLSLTLEEPSAPLKALKIVPQKLLLPEKTPVELMIKLPGSLTYTKGDRLIVTLPWGVRLMSISSGAAVKDVALKVKKSTVTTIELAGHHLHGGTFFLQLGSDLPPSAKELTGSVLLEQQSGAKGPLATFALTPVKDIQALPPRRFRLALSIPQRLPFPEGSAEMEEGLLLSGANIFVSPRLTVSETQLKTARISRRVNLHIPSATGKGPCHYMPLRDESFWEKHFEPALQRFLFRYGVREVEAIFCDLWLGQRRGINCLCSLCRTELADFAPHLPQKNVMTLSSGILLYRHGEEVRNFRNARLNSLWAGARLQLPVGRKGFARRPYLLPVFTLHETLNRPLKLKTHEAVIDFGTGFINPEDGKYAPALNFLAAEKFFSKGFALRNSRTGLTAKISPDAENLSQEQMLFEILKFYFCGFTGVWVNLPENAHYHLRSAVAKAGMTLREYEPFLRSSEVKGSPWQITANAPAIEIPPVPGPAGYPMELPSSTQALRPHIFQQGNTTLAVVGNLAAAAVTCRLKNPKLPAQWQGTVDERSVKGEVLRKEGLEMVLPPNSWNFIPIVSQK